MSGSRANVPVVVASAPAIATDRVLNALRTSLGTAAPVLSAVAGGEDAGRSVRLLTESFPEARVIFMAAAARDPVPAQVAGLGEARWMRVDRDGLLGDARGELIRICEFAGLTYDQAMLSAVEAVARELRTEPAQASPYASASTTSFKDVIQASGGSLLISTYQTHRLVCVRARAQELNTHFRFYDKPMGMAVAPGRLAIGTRTEVFDLRDMPAAAPKIDPPGTHDACFLPRNRHVTGDIAIHDLGFAAGELWLVATAFSCLATLDAEHSFVPRWTPPWISQLAPEDRCHLNGMAIRDGRVTHVTALGTGNEAGSWREGKAAGGVLVDVASSQIVFSGLSMPHSPRWHLGHLWLLESGKGTLCVCDPTDGRIETVAELPGFTRGLTFVGDFAFIGLSQIRESSTFGDLPVTHRLSERQSGVWMVNVRTGEVAGFLRFEDLVQEIFDVAFLPGKHWPEVADAASETAAQSFVLPD